MKPRLRGDNRRSGCSVETALDLIGGRWKGVVLFWLLSGRKRFGELRRQLPNCTQRMLTLQLRELEEDGLVTRTVYAEVPPRVEYELTVLGHTLEPVLRGLCAWGAAYKEQAGEVAVREEEARQAS
jgi:DNA-binding HxlR family transcriptional regulator